MLCYGQRFSCFAEWLSEDVEQKMNSHVSRGVKTQVYLAVIRENKDMIRELFMFFTLLFIGIFTKQKINTRDENVKKWNVKAASSMNRYTSNTSDKQTTDFSDAKKGRNEMTERGLEQMSAYLAIIKCSEVAFMLIATLFIHRSFYLFPPNWKVKPPGRKSNAKLYQWRQCQQTTRSLARYIHQK